MNHLDHVALIRDGVVDPPGGEPTTWADVGAGTGAFTLALADLLSAGSRIIAVDRDATALEANAHAVAARFPGVALEPVVADLTGSTDLPPLDGLVAANVLHFVDPRRRTDTVTRLVEHLRPDGRFVLVEYETSRPTSWLPYPLPFAEWEELAAAAGLVGVERIGAYPGASGGGMYAALARVP